MMAVQDSYGLVSVAKAIQNIMKQQFGAENVHDGIVFWFELTCFRE